VVDVAVRVEEAGDGTVAAVLAVEGERRRRGLGGDQRVDDDDPLVALDHVQVREVEAAQLVDARRQLEQAGDPVEAAEPPERRVGGLGRLTVEELVGAQVPGGAAVVALDQGRLEGGDEPAPCFLEVAFVLRRQRAQRLAVAARRVLARGLGAGAHASSSAAARKRGAAA
jgi:hypothetical protein